MPVKVAVLGATGMLGSMVHKVLSGQGFDVIASRRWETAYDRPGKWTELDARTAVAHTCREAIAGASWVVNCIGITKPMIKEDDKISVKTAIQVNAVFPHILAEAAETTGARVIQIATDCVYSGLRGGYLETDEHDALDVYGKTKSLGEVQSPNVHHLRCSIIGPEPRAHKFLLDWVSRQPRDAEINGFTNHDWNGITTLHFARIAAGIIKADLKLPHIHHLCPADRMTKARMVAAIATAYDRGDIRIRNIEAPTKVDRTLATNDPALNARIWSAAGYDSLPSVAGMIEEVAASD